LFLTPLPPLLPSLAADSLVNGMLPVLIRETSSAGAYRVTLITCRSASSGTR
jgi:hypothetical protein